MTTTSFQIHGQRGRNATTVRHAVRVADNARRELGGRVGNDARRLGTGSGRENVAEFDVATKTTLH